ncbi:MAG TPA: MurT ligase domain-containing protein [Dehalococcoidia bacterium]|nr:MurT ligase domain-containing protein [Dehalococcoidia bacterium]
MRRIAAIAAAKAAAALSRRLKAGGGTALPGLVAQRIDPAIVPEMARRLGQGSVIVTGTNGKTTTARLLRGIVRAAGLRVVANRAGSNLMRGIAAALADSANLDGSLPAAGRCIGVFEVDEATVPEAAGALAPRLILFTNLFRDQLDRYGEVEHVAALWRDAVRALGDSATVVLNADDPSVASLAQATVGRAILYGVEDTSRGLDRLEHAADARWCSACGAELAYATVFYGHLGHWRCPACRVTRPPARVVATRIEPEAEGTRMTIAMPGGEVSALLPLAGLYNAYNGLAAVAAAWALDIAPDAAQRGLDSATAAFGRQERLMVAGRWVEVILAKNPAGLNEVLRTITADGAQKDVALFLNDDIADGRDVSWIWDVDFELLAGKVRSLTVSGRRAWDMALRLKYGGLDSLSGVEEDAAAALRRALKATPQDATLYVIPTYTAMLKVRELLARWARQPSFWEAA